MKSQLVDNYIGGFPLLMHSTKRKDKSIGMLPNIMGEVAHLAS